MAKPPKPEIFGIAEDIQCPSQPLLATLLFAQPGISIVEIPIRGLHPCIRFAVLVHIPSNVINIRTSSAVLYLEIIFDKLVTSPV
jgi:hypothetical protein